MQLKKIELVENITCREMHNSRKLRNDGEDENKKYRKRHITKYITKNPNNAKPPEIIRHLLIYLVWKL